MKLDQLIVGSREVTFDPSEANGTPEHLKAKTQPARPKRRNILQPMTKLQKLNASLRFDIMKDRLKMQTMDTKLIDVE